MRSTAFTVILAATASLVAGSPTERNNNNNNNARRTVVDYGVKKEGVGARTVEDYGVHNENGGRVFRRGNIEIIDLGVRDLPKGDLLEARTTDGISSCGSKWMPIWNQQWGMGYDAAVNEYCYHVTHSFDGKATVIGPGQYHAALVKDGYTLKDKIPAAVDFEIHNKMGDGSHTPNEDDCKTYLKKMQQTGQSCYGKNNIDTKGGTWQVGAEKVSYHGLPQALV
ncbi:uncharacterized protein JN550_012510 [Neoarthrinium moseri]|uniref:uncharacterized protein n=1 Tax=Neoarthrinium moseri TaxID=1658444 RepID=UPI001FDE812D|nr:uncharacterized protein JN550_012510 [Neoarthrinium moseri]KAI1858760.1 hypothetical protein JN550_012510 [Neoarthrinium moseri]